MKKKSRLSKEEVVEVLKSRIRFFVERRKDILIAVLLIMVFRLNSTTNFALEEKAKTDAALQERSQYVTYISDSGVNKKYKQDKFDVFAQKNNVAKELVTHLVASTWSITSNYTIKMFASEKSVYNAYTPFQEFSQHFLQINSSAYTPEQKKLEEIAQNDFLQILRAYKTSLNSNDLPHTMDIKISGTNVSKWETKDNTFSIILSVPIYCDSKTKAGYRDRGIAYAQIETDGYFNLYDGDNVNPNGMKFGPIKLILPAIDQNAREVINVSSTQK